VIFNIDIIITTT